MRQGPGRQLALWRVALLLTGGGEPGAGAEWAPKASPLLGGSSLVRGVGAGRLNPVAPVGRFPSGESCWQAGCPAHLGSRRPVVQPCRVEKAPKQRVAVGACQGLSTPPGAGESAREWAGGGSGQNRQGGGGVGGRWGEDGAGQQPPPCPASSP